MVITEEMERIKLGLAVLSTGSISEGGSKGRKSLGGADIRIEPAPPSPQLAATHHVFPPRVSVHVPMLMPYL